MRALLFVLMFGCATAGYEEYLAKPKVLIQPLWRWDKAQFPLDVILDAEMTDKEAEVQTALDWWNKQLGFVIFNQVNELSGHGLVVVGSLVEPAGPMGQRNVGKTSRADVGTVAVVSIDKEYKTNVPRVYAHEFGHVLGLNHSLVIRSVMYPAVEDGPFVLLPAERAALLRWLR